MRSRSAGHSDSYALSGTHTTEFDGKSPDQCGANLGAGTGAAASLAIAVVSVLIRARAHRGFDGSRVDRRRAVVAYPTEGSPSLRSEWS